MPRPLLPVLLEYVDESPEDASITQFVPDDVEGGANGANRGPAMITLNDLMNAEERWQDSAQTANVPDAVKSVHRDDRPLG